jgi:hypothetical protein
MLKSVLNYQNKTQNAITKAKFKNDHFNAMENHVFQFTLDIII